METAVLILILFFPIGLALIGVSRWLQKYIPDRLASYMALTGIAYYLVLEIDSVLDE
jgi:hypothetical protein